MAAEPLSAVEARLAEIEARAKKATEGPWEVAWNTPEAKKIGAYVYTKHLGAICACPRESPQFSVHLQHMEFIAHARTDIPYLLSLTRASSAREQALREALKKLTFAARTSGGVAGRDSGLCAACDEAEALLSDEVSK